MCSNLVHFLPMPSQISRLRSKIRQLAPLWCVRLYSGIKNTSSLLADYFYDISRYAKHSSTVYHPHTASQLEARIYAHYHVIEKGMSLPEPRLGYGMDIINELINLLNNYKRLGHSYSSHAPSCAISTLLHYVQYHEEKGHPVDKLRQRVTELGFDPPTSTGGAHTLSKEDILNESHKDFESLVSSRYSIRNFSGEKVSDEDVRQAITLAQKSPSVCNRQSSRVYIVSNLSQKNALLRLQTGNRGFGEFADKILIVTTDLSCFHGSQERNQCFIDGGLFAMSLLYAIHNRGIGACCLNWSASRSQDYSLRELKIIEASENVIMLIAVGHLPKNVTVARSMRRPLDEIIRWRT